MSLYKYIRIVLIILLAVVLVVSILGTVDNLRYLSNSSDRIIGLVLDVAALVLLFVGFLGSYKSNRQLLLVYAIIMSILIIVSIVQSQALPLIGASVIVIATVILAVYQAELIRKGNF